MDGSAESRSIGWSRTRWDGGEDGRGSAAVPVTDISLEPKGH